MGYNRLAEALPPDLWKLLPHTFAIHMSKGAWIAYKYLMLLSHIITTAIARGGGRILISMPPRHGKSLFTSYWLPAWFLANWPDQWVILATYEANFAMSWGRKVRNLFADNEKELGVRLATDSKSASFWSTTRGGGMITAGAGGPITGKGANLGLIDDPHKNWKEAHSESKIKELQDWYDSTFYTRLEPGATDIINHTRWGEDDIIGYILREKLKDGYYYVRFPAIAEEDDPLGRPEGAALCPERYDEKALSRIQGNVKKEIWAAMFQQRPAPLEGSIFKREFWKYYRMLPRFFYVIQTWDTASKKNLRSAYSVCQTWVAHARGISLVRQWRERVEYPQLARQARAEFALMNPNVVLIEDKDSGQALLQDLQQNTVIPVIAVNPEFDKIVRAEAVSPLQESGRVFLPDAELTECWAGSKDCSLTTFVDNSANFPNVRYKDEIDAMTQALLYYQQMSFAGAIQSDMPRHSHQLLADFRMAM